MYTPLARYVVAAALVRSADSGAGLGLVLLTVASGSHRAAAVGGLLVAALSAPHVAGPLLARRLDAAPDGRRLLAGAFACYAAAIAAATLLFGRGSLWLVGGCIVLAGLCGPLLTGGLSSRLAGDAARSGTDQGRAEGWDAVTYGVGGTAGPAVVAALSGALSPVVALLSVAGASLVAAGLTLTLPTQPAQALDHPDPLTVRGALAAIARTGPLRRVTYPTMVAAFAAGGLSLVAVALGPGLSSWSSAGATLAAVYGAGNLLGSLALTRWPMRGEPERLTVRHATVVGVTLALGALAPTYPVAVAAFLLAGAANAPFFTATLAARGRYAPSGARAQVFVTVAGLKVAAAAAGTAATGALLGIGPRPVLLGAGGLVVAAALAALIDRRRQPPTAQPPAA